MKKTTALPFFRALAVALLGLAVLLAKAQVLNEDDLRKIALPGNTTPLVGLECLPDGHTVWALCEKGDRILVVDTTSWSITRTIVLSGFGRGAEMSASADGRHVLLKETPPFGDPNKPKETHVVVLDAGTGAVVTDIPSAMDACLVPGEDAVAILSGEVITIMPFSGAARSFNVPGAAFAIAADPRSRSIAVGMHPDADLLGQVPSMRNDKKALKTALKFRQLVAVHSLDGGNRLHIVPEVYDLVQGLRFTRDGRLLVYSVADTRSGMAAGGHVDQVDAAAWEPLRASFMTWTVRPSLAIAPDGTLLALSSVEGRNKRKLSLYDLATGDTRLMIDLEQKHRYDKAEGEEHDERLGYAWLKDGRLLIAQGPSLGCYRP
jgi:hypothetical protein